MERLRKRRTPLRMSFTKTLNVLKTELEQEVCDKGVITDAFTKIESTFNEIKTLDDSIVDAMVDMDTCSESCINEEVEDNERYLDEFITISRRVKECVNTNLPFSENNSRSSENSSNDNKSKHYKLPKLNIKPFDSQLINYLSFWSQFKKIHDDKDLEDCDKFQYLLQSVENGTRARQLLESYPVTSENYAKAVEAFRERFGNKDLLIEVYVREFLKLVISNVQSNCKDKLPLPDLYMKLEAYLRSLESMGLDSETNSAWLYPMVESSLPEDVLKAWQRCTFHERNNGDANKKSNLTVLMEFLKREVAGEERLQLAKSGFQNLVPKEKEKIQKRESKTPTAAGLFAAKELSCLFCSKSHESKDCVNARSLSLQERKEKVREKNCCFKCLRGGHRANVCRIFVRCHICSKPHTELLCPDRSRRHEVKSRDNSSEIVHSSMSNHQCSREVALMTLDVLISVNSVTKKVRALVDSGSQKSYILKSTTKELGLKPLSTENIAHSLFGGAQTEAKPHSKFRVKLSAPASTEAVGAFDFLDTDKICGSIPRLPKGALFKELKRHRIWVSDIGPGSPEIELLLGSDMYGQLLTGQVKQLHNGLTAIHTKLGWTVCGQLENPSQSSLTDSNSMLLTNLTFRALKIPELWKLETIGITDPSQTISKTEEDELAHDHFVKEVTRNVEGRYCVGLPWVNGKYNIPSNRQVAEKRLMSTTKKLQSLKKLEDYDKVFQEWMAEGIISKVQQEDMNIPGHYLPHHPVIKPNSLSTSIRPVFDASCKVGRAPSLNDCLFKGPNLIEQIPAILLRFREKPIAVVADIRRAFLQIEVKEADRHYLRFLWWEKQDKIQVYQHNRVVFGATCSPFLLGAVLKHHLSNTLPELKSVAEMLSKSFYVDNCLTSVDSVPELENFILKSTDILADAKMDLRMWEFGPAKEIENGSFRNPELEEKNLATPVPVLGLQWDRKDDCLMICNQFDMKVENLSKRDILSITQGIFDPIGFLAPVLLPAKLVIQEAWSTKSEWDTPLPERLQKDFQKWYSDMKQVSSLKIKRRIGYGDKSKWSIHVYCDASQKAYATAVFLRCEDEDQISVQLLGAKSRLAPKKVITIPRLELLACVLGARLTYFILKSLDLSFIPVRFWTDSSTALAWIQRNDQWGTFVGNRIREICSLSDPQHWFFVPGNLNPADLPSRGCRPQQFLKTRWWEGPDWLRMTEYNWPKSATVPSEDLVSVECRKTATTLKCTQVNPFMEFGRISKFVRFIYVICWVKRFISKCRNRSHSFATECPSVIEKEEAEKILWSNLQKETFGDVENSVKGLLVTKDKDGLLRVRTKILDRDDEYNFRYPILLPAKHHVVECLIRDCHLKNNHAGIQTVGAMLREKYWIISSKRCIRSVVSKCVKCKRFTAKACVTPPIQLPSDRVRDSNAFEVVGIDLCGPLYLKRKAKVWIVLFTCAVYRAVHLELVTSLSTEVYIQAFRRFIARRGRPTTIYSDNGTNFTGTNNLLKNLDWEAITASEDLAPLRWKFIPPTAAWWGGWWERLIRTVKSLLIRTLGRSTLNYEELLTVICDVEATVNSRPLTYLSEEADSLVPLTPSMFIQDIPEVGVPDLDVVESKKLVSRYRYCQNLRKELRNRFRKEYLAELVQKANDKTHSVHSAKSGDIVLIEMSNQKRFYWPIGKITKIFPSRDRCGRVAEVRTSSGTLVRPLRKLYPLEISDVQDPIIQKVTEQRSKRGRLLKPVKN